MSQVGNIEAGSRHDLRVGISPDAPDESEIREDTDGTLRLCAFLRELVAV